MGVQQLLTGLPLSTEPQWGHCQRSSGSPRIRSLRTALERNIATHHAIHEVVYVVNLNHPQPPER
jgi:hypothetical protein